jgi:cytochrome c2
MTARGLHRTTGALLATALMAVGVAACAGESPVVLVGASASRGHDLILHYGCGQCHTIGGVQAADGKVGPSLQDFGDYRYLVGIMPRTPQNTARWIEHPQRYLPQGAMPDLGVTPAQARDIAAYLYSQ